MTPYPDKATTTPRDKIEITPAMRAAGACALLESDFDFSAAPFTADLPAKVSCAVFRAMLKAAR
jgi:hypothetical protein